MHETCLIIIHDPGMRPVPESKDSAKVHCDRCWMDFYSITYNMSFSRFLIEVRGPTSEKLNQGYT